MQTNNPNEQIFKYSKELHLPIVRSDFGQEARESAKVGDDYETYHHYHQFLIVSLFLQIFMII